ncbi:MAG: hypothetical protein K0R75_1631, partial [Paenibacillaceae bacterium]|nr:hypothetical protein [Paenibacillaceae bacterium]
MTPEVICVIRKWLKYVLWIPIAFLLLFSHLPQEPAIAPEQIGSAEPD